MGLDETFFITGFPGFIAGRLVKRLAEEGARLLLLVQPSFTARARQEVAHIIDQTGANPARFRLFEGDITLESAGLSPADLETVRRETTSVFHLAALYDLSVPRELAMKVNVEGTRNVNHLARLIPGLRRYHYVSTCYVAGKRTGIILESELRHDAGFRNYYEETKYLAELEVEALKKELPVTIYRPAVVCGDSQTGETAKYDGIYYLINYLRMQPSLLTLANIGNPDVRLNIVPVDFVVAGMVALAKDDQATGETVQLADPRPLTTADIFETVARTLAGHGSRIRVPPALVHTSLTLPFSPAITGLPRSAVPYFFIAQTYDTTNATRLLAPHGVHCPPFPSYVEALVKFVAQHPRL
jgi:nucleoside-diphosphate-sugar epimerase